MLRKHLNSIGKLGKSYLPADSCGKCSELAANKMPAYWTRLVERCRTVTPDGAEQPAFQSSDLMLPVASPPVMCWICGEGFSHVNALVKHCSSHHGDYAEYRKLVLWRGQQQGFKPLLPYVKRHIVKSASFLLAYSVPSTMCLG